MEESNNENIIRDTLEQLLTDRPISDLNRHYLKFIKRSYEPMVLYDIGASNTAWTRFAQLIFPNATIYLFDANGEWVKSYQGKNYFEVCLGKDDESLVPFYNKSKYNHSRSFSCYKSDGMEDDFTITQTTTLDTFISLNNIPLPDIVKINTCGSEKDIIKGGENTIKNAKYLIVNLQNNDTWKGAPNASEVGPYIQSLGFSLEDVLDSFGIPIVDYVFKKK
jgi:FkbM family methyltransferase